MPLCGICTALPLNVENLRSTEVAFHANLASLKASSENGCPFCILCWTALERESAAADITKQLTSEAPMPIQLYGCFEDHGSIRSEPLSSMGSYIIVNCGPADDRPYLSAITTGLYTHLNVHAGADAPAKGFIRGRLCAAEPNLLHAQLYLARMWLNECRKYHELCRGRSSNFWPLRVLYVGDGKEQTPRLIVDGQLPDQYAALSYCWGSSTHKRLRLLGSNLEELKESVDVNAMARTNREACEVVRRLGIKYIWIDALCIIQDSREDWRQQSQLMAQIYAGAYITIVAGNAADSADGFLHAVDPGNRVELPYSSPTNPELLGVVYASLQRSRKEGPVSTRAWCFQERALSRRMLVWGAEQIHFKCLEGTFYENGGGTFAPMTMVRTDLPEYSASEERFRQRMGVLRQWYSLVAEYSSRDLWDPADIFAAMSGIAQQAEKTLRCAYLAGIWDMDLTRGLLWQPANLQRAIKFKPLVRPKVMNAMWGGRAGDVLVRAPSWSWAASEGPVTYGSYFVARYDAVFLDTSRWRIRPSESDGNWSPQTDQCHATEFNMAGCTLRVIGKPKAVICSKASPTDTAALGQTLSLQRAVQQKRHVLLTVKEGPRAGDEVGVGIYDIVGEEEDEAWCLQVIDQRGAKGRHTLDGLLLRRCADADATFARVGIFRILDDDFFNDEGVEETLKLV